MTTFSPLPTTFEEALAEVKHARQSIRSLNEALRLASEGNAKLEARIAQARYDALMDAKERASRHAVQAMHDGSGRSYKGGKLYYDGAENEARSLAVELRLMAERQLKGVKHEGHDDVSSALMEAAEIVASISEESSCQRVGQAGRLLAERVRQLAKAHREGVRHEDR